MKLWTIGGLMLVATVVGPVGHASSAGNDEAAAAFDRLKALAVKQP
jgi:hypothetical protein